MSNAVLVFPPGLKFDNVKKPTFSTNIQRSVSGREVRLGLMAYPLWELSFSFEFLRNYATFNEFKALVGFWLQRRGSLDSFLYTDPDDSAVTDFQFGTGDGTTAAFPLTRSWGGFVEPVQNINVLTNIKRAGTVTTAYTINANGLVTFTNPPANGQALTWTGSYYWRCRFLEDSIEPSQFMKDLWELKKLELLGSVVNKL